MSRLMSRVSSRFAFAITLLLATLWWSTGTILPAYAAADSQVPFTATFSTVDTLYTAGLARSGVSGMAEPPLLESLGAVTALFVAILVLSAVGRQATRKSFQKRMFLFSLVLLIAAIVSNILLTLYLTGPASDPSQALIFTKRVQGTFDLLFAMSIGVFVLATAKPEIDSLKAFINHIRGQLPNPFLFYVFVQFLAIAVLWMSPIDVIVGVGANRIVFPSIFLFTGGLAFITVITYVPFMLLTYTRRIQARPSVKRDVYLIIAGVLGYTFFEFVVEVVLPFYAIDVRAGGFIVEMGLVALVAFAVREKGFLEDLLVPQAEAALSTAPSFELRRGSRTSSWRRTPPTHSRSSGTSSPTGRRGCASPGSPRRWSPRTTASSGRRSSG